MNEQSIQRWAHDPEWSGQNTALRASPLEVRIDVDDYGTKNGAAQLAALEELLGPLPATYSSTSRGKDSPSRQYFFTLKEPVEMVGKAPLGTDIDVVQSHHRYSVVFPSFHPETGSPYLWFDPEGEQIDTPPYVTDLEYLPEAWVEYLAAPEREYEHSAEQWDGEIPEVASDAEEHKLRVIITRLQGLPDVWAPGSGWHDTVFAQACWLWRIARSNAYALTPEQAYQLLLDHAPTYPGWGVDKIDEQWRSAKKTTEGQYEEPPLETRPPLIFDLLNLFETRTFPEVDGVDFFEAWGARPEKEGSGVLWHHRHQLLVALLGSGFTEQEAASLVWASAAAGFRIVFDGIVYADADSKVITPTELWREVDQSRDEVLVASGAMTPPAPADKRPDYSTPGINLLTDAERTLINGDAGYWWGRHFVEWARTTFPHVNEPYYRMNRWTILSICFSPKGILLKDGGNERPLIIYSCTAGATTSGKTESMWPVKQTIKAFFMGDNPDVGGDFTPESLENLLISRDGESTFFNSDEAHTKLAEWKKPVGPYTRMRGVVTAAYDGSMVAAHRMTRSENNGKHAETFMTTHLTGTFEGFADVIEPEDWGSGFMARFVWAIGEAPKRTKASIAGGWVTQEMLSDAEIHEKLSAKMGRKMFDQWAGQFQQASGKITRPDGRPSIMQIPAAAAERQGDFAWALNEIARSRPRYADRLEPTFIRMAETTLRCAALVALSEGRIQIQMTDLLLAIEQAEEWVANALIMVEATNESIRTRRVNEIERALISAGGTMLLRDIHLAFPNRRAEVKDYLEELKAQGRAELGHIQGAEVVKVK